jgi:hypothetical protein
MTQPCWVCSGACGAASRTSRGRLRVHRIPRARCARASPAIGLLAYFVPCRGDDDRGTDAAMAFVGQDGGVTADHPPEVLSPLIDPAEARRMPELTALGARPWAIGAAAVPVAGTGRRRSRQELFGEPRSLLVYAGLLMAMTIIIAAPRSRGREWAAPASGKVEANRLIRPRFPGRSRSPGWPPPTTTITGKQRNRSRLYPDDNTFRPFWPFRSSLLSPFLEGSNLHSSSHPMICRRRHIPSSPGRIDLTRWRPVDVRHP